MHKEFRVRVSIVIVFLCCSAAAARSQDIKTLEQMKDTTNLSQALGSVEKNLGIAMHD